MDDYKKYIIYFYSVKQELREYKNYRAYRMDSKSNKLTIEKYNYYSGNCLTEVEYWNAGCKA